MGIADYTRHTLDGAASLLNSNKYFPSRVSIKVNNNPHLKCNDYCESGQRHVGNISRQFPSGKQRCKAWFCLSQGLSHLLSCLLSPQVACYIEICLVPLTLCSKVQITFLDALASLRPVLSVTH